MPKVMQGSGFNARRVVVSLCDYSGNWPRPWNEAGHTVICFDLKHGDDVTTLEPAHLRAMACAYGGNEARVEVILAAPPCTTFTNSGARWWPKHDATGETAACLRVYDACMRLITGVRPRVWALENPAGRLPRLRPEAGRPAWYFDPYLYAGYADDPARDAYTKKTGIWGNCTRPTPRAVEPVMYERKRADGTVMRGSWMWANLGGKSERTKALRSNTPQGFARAFYAANRD